MTTQAPVLQLVLISVGLPVVAGLTCMLIRRRMSWLSPLIASLLLLASLILAIITFFKSWGRASTIHEWFWFSAGGTEIKVSVVIDDLSVVMFLLVSAVAFLIHVFSIGYMVGDARVSRYFAWLGFFTFSMLALVLCGNLLVLFCFWELIGTGSYFLIGHWNEKPKAAAAATKAFIMNRAGDTGFLIGLAIIWANTGSFDLAAISTATELPGPWVQWAGLCIFIGSIGKSAQLPLATWLPDAMEGPTPVSALIHGATMVAAGAFILLRVPSLFAGSTGTLIASVGALTALYAAVSALRENDLKRILAYSTISQLGVMMIGIGAQAWHGALFHLVTHALFKACLFLAAGSVIHSIHRAATNGNFDPQDIRNMGGLRRLLPNTFIAFGAAAASLAGLPLFSGFLSKEAILSAMVQQAMRQDSTMLWIFVGSVVVTSFLTVLYTFRMFNAVFLGEARIRSLKEDVVLAPLIMQLPTAILATLSLWIFFSVSPVADQSWVTGQALEQPTNIEMLVSFFSVVWVLIAAFVAFRMFAGKDLQQRHVYTLDPIYDAGILKPVFLISEGLKRLDLRMIDRALHGTAYSQVVFAKIAGWVDQFIVDGVVTVVYRAAGVTGNMVRRLGLGKIQAFILWSTAALIIFIFWQLR